MVFSDDQLSQCPQARRSLPFTRISRMRTSKSPGLYIDLHGQQASYSPGDILRGNVVLKLPVDSIIGRVTVRFVGRTNSKIVQSDGQSTATCRGSAVLFDVNRPLHEDHYTHKHGVFNWPFEFQVPDSVDRSCSREVWTAGEGFLATISDSQSHPLPPSFEFAEPKSSKGWHVSNTYTIEASVVEPQGSLLTKTTTRTSTKAVHVLPLPAIANIDLEDPLQRRGSTATGIIRTSRLLPEHATSLSLMQRMRFLFNALSLPKFTFDINISYSSLVQVHHPLPLPFLVSAIPRTDAESTTIQPSIRTFYRYPPLKVKQILLILRATTVCRCPTVLSAVSASASHNIILADRHFSDLMLEIRSVAWDQKNELEDDVPTSIDLGKECDVHVTEEYRNDVKTHRSKSNKATGDSSPAQALVTPSFTTCDVSRKYHLAWNIEFECAGEKIEVKGQSPEEVIVLGPAASRSDGLEPEDASRMMIHRDDGEGSDRGAETGSRNLEGDALPAYDELAMI